VHRWTEDTERLAESVLRYTRCRLDLEPVPLDGPATFDDLQRAVGQTVTPEGLGGEEALRLFAEFLAPACISTDHPRHFSFIPCAPTHASSLFDLVVGASSIYAGSWLEAAGAVFAENQALRWLADLAGLPDSAGGVFVQGGTQANLSALVTARHAARTASKGEGRRFAIAVSSEVHSSVTSSALVMDVDLVPVATDGAGRLTGDRLATALDEEAAGAGRQVFAVVASAGTTNLGVVDDLTTVADVAARRDLWFHVDAAYGGAGLAAPSVRRLFAGIERADSLAIDPHKWLFAPYDCAALLYREPELARAAHTQHAGYLEVLHTEGDWNPSDYAIQLTRRARGLPFWFSLATHGWKAYERAVERTLEVTRYAAAAVEDRDELVLVMAPQLSIVGFTRRGWAANDYAEWSSRLLAEGTAFVTPTTFGGEVGLRLAILNPLTTEDDIDVVLDSLR